MRKLFLLILPILAVSFAACSKDDDGGDNGKNPFTIDGKTFNFAQGAMFYFGNYYSDDAVNIDLLLYLAGEEGNDDLGLYFEFHAPNGNTKLVAGTYYFDEHANAPFTYSDGKAATNGEVYYIAGGTVTIAVSGSTYTITMNCMLDNGGTMNGTYKGALAWYDVNED